MSRFQLPKLNLNNYLLLRHPCGSHGNQLVVIKTDCIHTLWPLSYWTNLSEISLPKHSEANAETRWTGPGEDYFTTIMRVADAETRWTGLRYYLFTTAYRVAVYIINAQNKHQCILVNCTAKYSTISCLVQGSELSSYTPRLD